MKRVVLWLFLLAAPTQSQTPLPETFTTRDGLPSNVILCELQDSRSYLWFGTNNGLSRYDGTQFTNFSSIQGLSNNWITEIVESPKEPGTLWIGTIAGGVNRLRDESVTVFRLGSDDASNNINNIAVDTAGTVWATTSFGLFLIRGDSVSHVAGIEIPATDNLVSLSDGTTWLARENHLLVHGRREDEWVPVRIPGAQVGVITSLAPCRNGGVWIAWSNGTITRMQGAAPLLALHQSHGGATRIVDDGNGTLWIRTQSGLFTVPVASPENTKVVVVPHENPVPADVSPPVILDSEGNAWIGTWSNGIVKISQQSLFLIPARFSREGSITAYAISDSSGHIWVGARGGIVEYYLDPGNNWQQHLHALPDIRTNEDCYASLTDAFGRLWIVTKELREIRAYTLVPRDGRPSGLTPFVVLRRGTHFPEGTLLTLFAGRKDRMFVSVGKVGVALVSLEPLVLQGIMTPADSIPGPDVRTIVQDDAGTIWMGGWNDGICVFSPGDPKPKFVRRYVLADGLPDNSIRAIHQDRSGVMWVGTRHGGLARFRDGRFSSISMQDGLLSNSIWSIAEDEHDRLYVGTDAGIESIDRHTGSPLFQKSELRVPSGGSFGIVPGKYLWYATNDGFSIFMYNMPSMSAHVPPVYIRSLLVNGRAFAMTKGIELAWTQNTCTFEYVGISYKDERGVRYQYRLFGVDSAWTPATANRSVSFANLRPGEYRFEVRAISGDGVPSAVPASLAFSITPPFWLRWWFIVMCAVGAGTLLFGGYRYRLRTILDVERLRTRIAADLHDDVGTNLSSIMLATQIMERKFSISEDERRELGLLRETAGHTRGMLKDIVWFLNPGNDSSQDFVFKLKEIAGRILLNTPFRFTTSGVENMGRMSLEMKRHIVLMFKEALTNIIKHAEAKTVEIDLAYSGDILIMTIRDDGGGFDTNASSGGNGIVNLRTRARTIGGELTLHSAKGEGTMLRLSVNITHMRSSK